MKIFDLYTEMEEVMKNQEESQKLCIKLIDGRNFKNFETIGKVYVVDQKTHEVIEGHSKVCEEILKSSRHYKEKIMDKSISSKDCVLMFVGTVIACLIMLFYVIPNALLIGEYVLAVVITSIMFLLFAFSALNLKISFVKEKVDKKYEEFEKSLIKVNLVTVDDDPDTIGIYLI